MSKKRYIDTRFWTDTWVMDHLSRDAKLLYIYLMTNDKTNVAGVYEISLRTVQLETDFTQEEAVFNIKKLQPKVRYYDGWVVLQNAIKHQSYKNPKIVQGIISALSKCPQELLEYVSLPNDAYEIKEYVSKHSTPENKLDMDSLSIGLQELSHSDSDSDLDINPNASPQTYKNKKQKPASKETIANFRLKRKELGI